MKRYGLTKSNNEIIDFKSLFSNYKNLMLEQTGLDYDIEKQSDNIIYLLKEGDMVKAPKFHRINKRKLYEVINIEFYNFDGEQRIAVHDEFNNNLTEYITDIWKRQNNDFIHYSVNEEEKEQ